MLKAAVMASTSYEQEECKKNADADNYVEGKTQQGWNRGSDELM